MLVAPRSLHEGNRAGRDRDEVERRLAAIMEGIHRKCRQYGARDDGSIDYVKGANIAAS